jgi:hypothetical protein
VIRVGGARQGKTGIISVDSVDGQLTQRYNLRWFGC